MGDTRNGLFYLIEMVLRYLKKLSEAKLFVNINSVVRTHQSAKFTRGTFFTITVYKLCSMIAKMIYLNRHF